MYTFNKIIKRMQEIYILTRYLNLKYVHSSNQTIYKLIKMKIFVHKIRFYNSICVKYKLHIGID